MKTKIYKKITFRRLGPDERLEETDFHSLDEGGMLMTLKSPDSVGQIVSSFSKDRSFWRAESISRLRKNS